MKYRTSFTAAVALLAAMASAANAADLFTNPGASLKDVVSSSGANSWTGFYIGGNIGAGWDSNQDINSANVGGTPVSTSGLGLSGLSVTPSGWFGGLQGGFGFQSGSFTGGIETDIQVANLNDSSVVKDSTGTAVGQVNSDLDWWGTTRLKGGFLIGKINVYGTGGVAYGGVRTTATSDRFQVNLSNDNTRFGWVLGGGAEAMISKDWSAGLEYLHVDLGSDTLSGVADTFKATTNSVHNEFDAVRIRASYHLN